MKYYGYSTVDGRILQTLDYPAGMFPAPVSGDLAFVQGTANPVTHYVTYQGLVARPTFNLQVNKFEIDADGVDEVTITNIPANTEVTWPDGERTIINNGIVEFAVDLAGTYTFRFINFPYQDQEISIEANATA